MSRPFRARALAAVLVAIAATGCQDYNFNPVGHCVLQPGNQRFTLSTVSSADVLFVVDDSGSMASEQERLGAAFSQFVANLTATNVSRAQGGLLPIDFHIAVTTTSVFANRQPSGSTQMCLANCGGSGKTACCRGNAPVFGPRRCTALGSHDASQCPMQPDTVCSNTCNGLKGALYCCRADGSFPQAAIDATHGQIVECSVPDVPCGDLKTHYEWTDAQCTPATRGVSLEGFPYPDGAFVGSTDVVAGVANPRVLHFDKRLYLSAEGKNAQGFTSAQLQEFFKQNVMVGTCGSPQEQGLQAARRAIEGALAGSQLDTYAYDYAAGLTSGTSSLASQTFSAPGGMPTLVTPAVWSTPNSKLVVVFVGDEDDCSSPKNASGGVVLLNTDGAGQDACSRDATEPAPLGGKAYAIPSFVSYLTGLNRPLGAAFIVSARTTGDDVSCSGAGCEAGICCDRACVAGIHRSHLSDPDYSSTSVWAGLCGNPADPSTCVCSYDTCGGQSPGTRFVEASKKLREAGADVVVGSICGGFGSLLDEVAEIVKPPQTLTLPTVPAESRISMLRIATAGGATRKICRQPLAPTRPNYATLGEAQATGADWWFAATADPGPPHDPTPAGTTAPVAAPTRYVYINPRGACIANPGETYSLDYLGVVPQGGCVVQAGDVDGGGAVLGSADCQVKLGGRFSDWQCYVPEGLTTGTCQCRSGG